MKTIETIKENGIENYAGESLKKLFAPISFSKHIAELDVVREMIMNTSKQSLFKTLHALAERAETCTKLHEIKVPVLIMTGKEDELTPPEVAMIMHEKIKSSTIHIIDHAGHLSNMENSDEFNNHLSGFLKPLTQ
jgi:pimeloyl-ACP methyl ester carboxylesterase